MLQRLLTLSAACGLLLLGIAPLAAQPGDCDAEPMMAMISRAPDGSPGNDGSSYPVISGNEHYIAFRSSATDLVPSDTNGVDDVFVYNRLNCQIRRVSITADGEQGNGDSGPLNFSEDGRYLLMLSSSTNFDPAYQPSDNNDIGGLFLLDLEEQEFTYIGLWPLLPDMSGDGRYVVYPSLEAKVPEDTNNEMDIYLYDRIQGTTKRITPDVPHRPDRWDIYYLPAISADGNYIAFSSNANELVLGDSNNLYDIFLYEPETETFTRITVNQPSEEEWWNHGSAFAPALSGDGRYMVFSSHASNRLDVEEDCTVEIYIYDRVTDHLTCLMGSPEEELVGIAEYHWNTDVSDDGRYIGFAGQRRSPSGSLVAAYIYDRFTSSLILVSRNTSGQPGNIRESVKISSSGRFAAFYSDASVLTEGSTHTQVFLTDWQALTGYIPEVAPQRNVYTTATPTLTWSLVTWAVGYEIEIDDDDDFSSPAYHNATLTTPEVTLSELSNGVYYWRVRAQRPNGSWSSWSAVDSFVVDVP